MNNRVAKDDTKKKKIQFVNIDKLDIEYLSEKSEQSSSSLSNKKPINKSVTASSDDEFPELQRQKNVYEDEL